MTDNIFSALDDLISQAIKADKAKKQLTGHVAKQGADIVQLKKTVRDWEEKYVWYTTSRIAIFTRFNCTCGESQLIFSHFMLQQSHRTSHATRYCRATKEVYEETMPRDITTESFGVQVRTTPLCAVCSSFDLSQPPMLEVIAG